MSAVSVQKCYPALQVLEMRFTNHNRGGRMERRRRRRLVDTALHFADAWNRAARQVRNLDYLGHFPAGDAQKRRVEDLSVQLYEAAQEVGEAYNLLDAAERLEPHYADLDGTSHKTDEDLTAIEEALAEEIHIMKELANETRGKARRAEGD